ncbi:MAG: hypothetical protein ND866_04230 [Pyrinomonadaceae bacterium]|nr:hypothetical protein [Pyrinomonadaceae bacterium]
MEHEATPETEGSEGLTVDQGVSALLEKWNKPQEGEKPEESEVTEEEQPQGDAQPEEAEEEPGEVEIDVGGAKFRAPASFSETFKQVEAKVKEIEAGATRKFQEAADLRKAVEVQSQSVAQLQKVAMENADLLADHRMVARRMQQLESVDIQGTDADTLTRLNAEYNQLQAAKTRIEAQYQQNVGKMREEDAKGKAAKREHAEKVLSSTIKGWSPEYGKKLAEYAISRGAPQEVLRDVSEAWMVAILDDAAYGHSMRQKKPEVDKRVTQTPKTLSPGATGNQSATVAKVKSIEQRFKKSHSVQDAAALLLARSQTRRN